MTRRTRYFLLGSTALLVAGLCTGLVAYYAGFPGLTPRIEGPVELRYVPGSAAVVGFANVRDVMTSDLRQRLREVTGPEKGQQEFQEKTGINIETDIDTVVGCIMPRGETGESAMALIRGRFDNVRIESFAREHGSTAAEYQGKRLLTAPHSRETGALAFLEPGLIALGEDSAVRQAVDLHVGGAPNITTNAEIMALIRELESGNNAWAVGRFDVLASRARLPENVSAQIPAITLFAASGRLNGGIAGTVRAEARDPEAAENLRDVVRGFLALARLQTGSRPEFQNLLQSLQLTGTGNTVAISFAIPSDLIDAFAPKNRQPAPQ